MTKAHRDISGITAAQAAQKLKEVMTEEELSEEETKQKVILDSKVT